MAMSEAAKAARAAYLREYRKKKSREWRRQQNELYWERKATKENIETEEESTEGGDEEE